VSASVNRSVCHTSEPSKRTEPIEMPFGLWARMSLRNHVLDGSPEMLRYVAMATNFVTQFAITSFLASAIIQLWLYDS